MKIYHLATLPPFCHEQTKIQGDPANLPDHVAAMVALKSKKSFRKTSAQSAASSCVTCQLTGPENKLCLHCQKVQQHFVPQRLLYIDGFVVHHGKFTEILSHLILASMNKI
jgi:hypothetical protein